MRVAYILLASVLPVEAAAAANVSSAFTVSVTVTGSCTVSSSALGFGSYSGGQTDAASSIATTCSSGTNYEIGLDAGTSAGATVDSRQLTGSGVNVHQSLGYALYSNSARTRIWGNTPGVDTVAGVGTGASSATTVYGRIPGNQRTPDGRYTDLVNVVVSF